MEWSRARSSGVRRGHTHLEVVPLPGILRVEQCEQALHKALVDGPLLHRQIDVVSRDLQGTGAGADIIRHSSECGEMRALSGAASTPCKRSATHQTQQQLVDDGEMAPLWVSERLVALIGVT